MAILDVGFQEIIDYIGDNITSGIAGTSATAISISQTGLQGPVAVTETAVVVTKGTKTVETDFIISPTTSNGVTFYEWGLKLTDGIYLSRGLTAGVSKTATDQITVKQLLYVERG
jgi:hypothetical protein